MIRCVRFEDGEDLDGRPDYRFAFYDTVPDRFVTLAGEQAWRSVDDLREAWDLERGAKHDWDRLAEHVAAAMPNAVQPEPATWEEGIIDEAIAWARQKGGRDEAFLVILNRYAGRWERMEARLHAGGLNVIGSAAFYGPRTLLLRAAEDGPDAFLGVRVTRAFVATPTLPVPVQDEIDRRIRAGG